MNDILRVTADFEAIRAVGPWLRSVLEPLGPEQCAAMAGSIELAVHEMATNSIDHGKSTSIELKAQRTNDAVDIILTDDGLPFEGRQGPAPHPDEPQVRGYGLMIVEALTESIDYERVATGNRWTMRFALESNESNSST